MVLPLWGQAYILMANYRTDILVIGSGAGGLTAALAAAQAGRKVVIAEKSKWWGGASATSGGFIWIPNSPLVPRTVANDSLEEAFQYIRALTDSWVPDANIRAFLQGGGAMLEWLQDATRVRARPVPYADYRMHASGAKLAFRTHDIEPMDGRELGDHLETLRPSARAALLFNRLAFTMEEVHPLLHRTPGWPRVLAGVLARYYLDIGQRLKSPRNRYLAAGNALLGRLRWSLAAHDSEIWLNSPLQELRTNANGVVTGAVLLRDGKTFEINCDAVILASGGFEANASLRRAHLPGAWDVAASGSVESNTGDALGIATAIGASSRNLDSAWWGPMLRFPDEDRARLLTFERALPGSLIVNQAGRRYMNEALAYDLAGKCMIDCDVPGAGTNPSWFLFDQRYRDSYPIGPINPGIPLALHQKGARDMLTRESSWADVARKIGVSSAALEHTIARFNANAKEGKDPEFGRGESAYDQFYGDPKVKPNPNLAPLDKPPFYAMPVIPGDIGTNGGLVTDADARVLNEQGQPILGLYATGNVTASVMGHSYPGAGATLGPAMTFGFIAGRHAARVNDTRANDRGEAV
jgi:3-oxosteroid 1-dehydrogenase